MTNRWLVFRRMLSEMRFVRMLYKSWTQVLQNLGFEKGPGQLLLAGTRENDHAAGEIWENEPFCLIPELEEFNRLFAQMDILHQKLIKSWSRDTLICERVWGNLTPTPPGVDFWMTKIRFYCACHRKTATATTNSICRLTIFLRKIQDSEKNDSSRIVCKNGARRNQGAQQ